MELAPVVATRDGAGEFVVPPFEVQPCRRQQCLHGMILSQQEHLGIVETMLPKMLRPPIRSS